MLKPLLMLRTAQQTLEPAPRGSHQQPPDCLCCCRSLLTASGSHSDVFFLVHQTGNINLAFCLSLQAFADHNDCIPLTHPLPSYIPEPSCRSCVVFLTWWERRPVALDKHSKTQLDQQTSPSARIGNCSLQNQHPSEQPLSAAPLLFLPLSQL